MKLSLKECIHDMVLLYIIIKRWTLTNLSLNRSILLRCMSFDYFWTSISEVRIVNLSSLFSFNHEKSYILIIDNSFLVGSSRSSPICIWSKCMILLIILFLSNEQDRAQFVSRVITPYSSLSRSLERRLELLVVFSLNWSINIFYIPCFFCTFFSFFCLY
jgi:hypothetical protein